MIGAIQHGFSIPLSFPYLSTKKKEREIFHFGDLSDLQDLARTLTAEDCDLDQWMTWKNEIAAFISEHSEDLEALDEFFDAITEWGIERNPQKTMAIFVDIVSLDLLKNVVGNKQENSDNPFEDIFDLAAKNAPDCPKPPDTSMTARFQSKWKKCRPQVLYFIPNLINISLGAFNFLDSHKKFTTLWDKHLLLEIVYKFCIIPYCLIKVLQTLFVVTAAKVYLIATITIVTTGILLACYQVWFRPIPDELVNCTNLDKKMEMGLLNPKIGQTDAMARLIAALGVDDNVLLIGLSGEGKTALIHHFIQLKKEGKVQKNLQRLTVFENDCGVMISSLSFGHSELINQIKEQIENYEDDILIFFDEFSQILKNPAARQAFKQKFLNEDKPHSKFIAAVTYKEWEELKKLDVDRSFRRRVVEIEMDSSTDEEIKEIIKNFQHHFAQDIPCTEEAIQAIVEISAKEDYLPDIGRPAKAIELFKRALGLCRAAYHRHYISITLSQEELKTNQKQVQKIQKVIAHQNKIKSDYGRLTHLFSKAVVKEDQEPFENIPIDLDHLEKVDILDCEEEEKSKIPAQPPISKKFFSEKDQILYLWYWFYALDAIENFLESEIEQVDSQIPIEINKELIDRIYEEIKEREQNEQEESEIG